MVATLRHNASAEERIAHADFARQAEARRQARIIEARRQLKADRRAMVLGLVHRGR